MFKSLNTLNTLQYKLEFFYNLRKLCFNIYECLIRITTNHYSAISKRKIKWKLREYGIKLEENIILILFLHFLSYIMQLLIIYLINVVLHMIGFCTAI